MQNKLIIITRNYPFGKGEEFFEPEINYLSQEFEQIYIISLSSAGQLTRDIPKNVTVFRYPSNKLKFLQKIFCLKYAINRIFLNELFLIRSSYKLKIRLPIIRNMLSTMYRGNKICSLLNKNISGRDHHSKIYLYSYWMNAGAYAIAKYKASFMSEEKDIKAFCRSHGSDLYFERSKFSYLPFRTYIINNLDNIYVISQDGKNYLENRFENIDQSKIIVSRLGINNTHGNAVSSKDSVFRMVSCSFITKVKRINLIIEALSNIEDKKIEWTHIGDGDIRTEIEKLAQTLLGSKENILFKFKGHLSNKEVYEYYENNEIDVFINVSASEGIPVSMMEAMSFSIPIIATNVGGVSEIVNNENGILLTGDPSANEIRLAILKFIILTSNEIENVRGNAVTTWKEFYTAERNYNIFINSMRQTT